jgi:hypothetical protein
MKATELVKMLNECIQREGDLDVYVWDDLVDYPTIIQGVDCLVETTITDKDGNSHKLPERFALTNY